MPGLLPCLILLTNAVIALKLPGPCPKVPPTHLQKTITSTHLVFVIPFSLTTPSFLFRAFNASQHPGLHIHAADIHVIQGLGMAFETYSVQSEKLKPENVTFTFKTTLRDLVGEKLLCPLPIIEDVRLWFENGHIFVWSCVEGGNSKDHDEAILIGSDDFYVLKKDLIKSSLEKFVSPELFSIIFSNETANSHKKHLYTCPSNINKIQTFLTVSAVFAFVILAAFGGYFYLKRQTKGKEDVEE